MAHKNHVCTEASVQFEKRSKPDVSDGSEALKSQILKEMAVAEFSGVLMHKQHPLMLDDDAIVLRERGISACKPCKILVTKDIIVESGKLCDCFEGLGHVM